ncbi:mCG148485 [Mus musculus]|nr:mCG148485 [Mus musculus]
MSLRRSLTRFSPRSLQSLPTPDGCCKGLSALRREWICVCTGRDLHSRSRTLSLAPGS